MADNPDYGSKIRFIVVDWDQYGDGELSRALKIPRRSTLVALKGREEIGRKQIVGKGHKYASSAFDHQRPVACWQRQPFNADRHTINAGGFVRGAGGSQYKCFGEYIRAPV